MMNPHLIQQLLRPPNVLISRIKKNGQILDNGQLSGNADDHADKEPDGTLIFPPPSDSDSCDICGVTEDGISINPLLDQDLVDIFKGFVEEGGDKVLSSSSSSPVHSSIFRMCPHCTSTLKQIRRLKKEMGRMEKELELMESSIKVVLQYHYKRRVQQQPEEMVVPVNPSAQILFSPFGSHDEESGGGSTWNHQMVRIKQEIDTSHFTVDCAVCQKKFPCMTSYEEHQCLLENQGQIKDEEEINWDMEVPEGMLNLRELYALETNICPDPECNKPLCNKSSMRDHYRALHLKEKRFICSCERGFFSRREYILHLRKTKHKGVTDRSKLAKKKTRPAFPIEGTKCLVCRRKFLSKFAARIHYRRVHLKEKRFFCDLCGKGFFMKNSVGKHMKFHEKIANKLENPSASSSSKRKPKVKIEKPQLSAKVECDQCGKEIVRSRLKNHIRFVHNGERPEKCKKCPKAFRNKKMLENHILHAHVPKRKALECAECGYAFLTFRMKLVHDMEVHQGKQVYQCTVCRKKFPFKIMLEKHSRAHLRKDPATASRKKARLSAKVKCDQCGREVTRSSFKNHVRSVHGEKPEKCQQCPKAFRNKKMLEQHILHTHMPKDKALECAQCSHTFRTFRGKLLHEREIHQGKPVYQCTVCNKRFPLKTHLQKHSKVHIPNGSATATTGSKTKSRKKKTKKPKKKEPQLKVEDITVENEAELERILLQYNDTDP